VEWSEGWFYFFHAFYLRALDPDLMGFFLFKPNGLNGSPVGSDEVMGGSNSWYGQLLN
jgi:hypothetical protein